MAVTKPRKRVSQNTSSKSRAVTRSQDSDKRSGILKGVSPPVPSSHTQPPLTTNASTSSVIAPPKKKRKIDSPVRKITIMDAPAEIHLNILTNLDYKSLLSISATNKHFQELFKYNNNHTFKLALLAFEEKSPAWRTHVPGKLVHAPCYGCLKTLTKCHFQSEDLVQSQSATGERAFRRRCQTCKCRGKLTGASRVITAEASWLYCEGCKTVTHLKDYDRCGIWDHTRGGSISRYSQHPLKPHQSLCRECKPLNWE